MTANDLLLWMSARGSGSWSQFREAVERYLPASDEFESDQDSEDSERSRLPMHHVARFSLEQLGHAEFFGAAGDEDWRVGPAVLVVGRSGQPHGGFLVGARSEDLIRRLVTNFSPQTLRVEPIEAGPDSIFLDGDTASGLLAVAASTGLIAQPAAPEAMLAAVRELGSRKLRDEVDEPLGSEWRIEHFRERELRWGGVSRRDMNQISFGLFRMRYRFRTEIFLRWGARAYRTTLSEGKFLILRRLRKNVLQYDALSKTLAIPAICRPPILIDRALVLCSGRLPIVEMRGGTPQLAYRDIPSTIAQTAASLLRQRLT